MSQLLFLDTNVFLSFFHFSKDDLEKLRQLTVLVKRKKVTLLLPDQVIQEFHRNRDGKVAEALKQLEGSTLPTQYPRFCHDFPEYKQVREKLDEYEQARKALLEKVTAAARDRKFLADKTTEELFRAATVVEVGPELFAQANYRYRRGNPPGKQDKRESLGDAINWEALLSVDLDGDLFVVAEDLDWASPLDSLAFNSFLQDEWAQRKKGQVQFYQRLSRFLEEHFPDIKLASELDKDALIDELAFTRNFAQTHRAIAALTEAGDFTTPQLDAILNAYVTNDQVYRIVGDPDVKQFLLQSLNGREFEVDADLLQQLVKLIDLYAPNDSDFKHLRSAAAFAF